jgi:glucose-fructose oxidoreductase
MRKWRIVGISFEHMHMGDLLREADEHPNAKIAGVCDDDQARMADAIANFSIPSERVYRDVAHCVREAQPDLAILCPATARHADLVEEVAALGVDLLLEKPFASLACRRRPHPWGRAEVASAARCQLAFALVSAPCDNQAADR